ncbi:MAG: tRNA-guanine transglycosylase, partial [Mucilaginibacter polytrichastri]|nr:tRNA-guanine transglycosylase [Mucilaginibacter polytrichastri]
HALLFTSEGRLNIGGKKFAEDHGPADPACACSTCRRYSRAYLRHLFQAGEILFSTLATLHNVHHYLSLMRSVRAAILEGRYPAFLADFRSRTETREYAGKGAA